MKTVYTSILLLLVGFGSAFAQCSEPSINRVLLVGDSWAAFQNADQTINNALKNAGHSDKKYVTSFSIAENGAETWDFLDQSKQTDIQNIINANPQIDMVHLSIGGNDVLGDWHISFTQQQTDSLEQAVAGRLIEIIDFLKSTRPGIQVFWAGYAYPNFGEIIEELGQAQNIHPFYGTWDGMGQPTFLQINNILNDFSDSVNVFVQSDPQVHFVPAQGILQHVYGQEQPLGIAPGGTYQPFEAPLPLGYPDYPSPKETMRPYGFFTDCFHLSTDAYLTMMTYQTQKFYQKYFMDDLYLLSAGGTLDGSVSSAGDVSQTIKLGDEGGNEVAAVLTFDTQSMADTTLSGASIFLRREDVTGTNPIPASVLQVKMVSGNFGTTADVEAADFMADADAEGDPCKFGSFSQDGHWLRLDLPEDMIAQINNSNQVQFMISRPGFTGGLITFSDATDPEFAPILNLNYGPEPDGINEIRAAKELPVYPIPTTGPLTIDVESNSVISIEVINVLGSVVLNPAVNDNRIDISELPNGSYVLRITTKEGISAKRIIKR